MWFVDKHVTSTSHVRHMSQDNIKEIFKIPIYFTGNFSNISMGKRYTSTKLLRYAQNLVEADVIVFRLWHSLNLISFKKTFWRIKINLYSLFHKSIEV